MRAPKDADALLGTLAELHGALVATGLGLEVAGVNDARVARKELVGQIDDYLIPRLLDLEAPLLAVVGGSTGAGKSTLVNSLMGAQVSEAGVLRPTTRAPVLVCGPEDRHWFEGDRILPRLARSSGSRSNRSGVLDLVVDSDVPEGVALLDAPDVDSIVRENRELATQLLAAADLWIFVTSAARYADAVPWEFLRTAASRSTALAVVLNRVPQEAMEEVPAHLRALLEKERLGHAPLFTVPESELDEGLLPRAVMNEIRRWLNRLGGSARARAALIRQTLEGALDSVTDRVALIATNVEAQLHAARSLRADVDRAFNGAVSEIDEALSSGRLLRGEVLDRWHEYVGTGDVMKRLEEFVGRMRDRVRDAFSGRPPAEEEVRTAVGSGVAAVVTAAADRACLRTVDSWRSSEAGRSVLRSHDAELESVSDRFRERLGPEIRDWQRSVFELVSAEGSEKRATGRALSLGVNATGTALMVVLFAHTGGLTGGEVAIAGGTAALSQKLLEALFGDQAVRDLTRRAREGLLDRVASVLETERQRFSDRLRERSPDPDEPATLHELARRLQEARR
ncbi:MAG: ABC transporter [Actinobacteria bacterium]|nr:ABC transporter [Actinomycetota bacterium]